MCGASVILGARIVDIKAGPLVTVKTEGPDDQGAAASNLLPKLGDILRLIHKLEKPGKTHGNADKSSPPLGVS